LIRVEETTPVTGRTIEGVRALGKHLIIDFSGDLSLRTHMLMNGSWHIYRPGERWQKSRRSMRVLLATDDFVAVAFDVTVADFASGRALERNEQLRQLGPDVLSEKFDLEDALGRVRSRADQEIGNVLLNQRVLSGIGNVYKSELLYLCGVHPFSLVEHLTDEAIRCLINKGRLLLRTNVDRADGGRLTRSALQRSEQLWVYGRKGKPCRKCGAAIEMRRQGADARVTFWCPRCQAGSDRDDAR
ncbi:MAG TPA: DNA-formamidopyrimidine glycosylase family protein, partial [Thermoanaerobaculia bacterium]|nr:DNA-formamidopyrimidine glycosylase family protein [Thermoanaerobaculia bacterium]